MEQPLHLIILTPYGRYFEGNVSFLNVRSEDYDLGIYPGHAPLISTVAISKMIIRNGDKEYLYAVGGGIINIDKEKVTLVLNSIERADEIDLNRALEAKKRAEERLSQHSEEIDIARAQASLARALQRINIKQGK